MKDFLNQNFVAILIAGFLVYWFLLKPSDNKEIDKLKQQNIELSQKIDSVKIIISQRLLKIDSLKTVNNYTIKKYYYESTKVDSVVSPDSLINIIRSQIWNLRPARFD